MLALVTTEAAAPHDPDLEPFARACRDLLGDSAVRVVSWDDPSVDWAEFDVTVIRSTWDYPERIAEFRGFIDRVSRLTRLVNDVGAINWNLDKHYLAELASVGIPVVPTRYVAPGGASPEVNRLSVVKPTVGAGSSGARRCEPGEVAAHVEFLHAAGFTAMVQPYLEQLDQHGESAHCYVPGADGGLELSHVFRKGAILTSTEVEQEGDLFAKEDIAPRAPSAEERAVADAVLASPVVGRFADVRFARVDVAPTPDGPVVMELELIEPSFYFSSAPGSADLFARRLVAATGLKAAES